MTDRNSHLYPLNIRLEGMLQEGEAAVAARDCQGHAAEFAQEIMPLLD